MLKGGGRGAAVQDRLHLVLGRAPDQMIGRQAKTARSGMGQKGALMAGIGQIARATPAALIAPLIGRLGIDPDQRPDYLERADQGLAYFQWCEVICHNAGYRPHTVCAVKIICVAFALLCVAFTAYLQGMDATWFKAQQKAKGLTSFDLGEAIGRDRTAISRILSGKQRMTLEQAGLFAVAFGVPLAEVITRAGINVRPAYASAFSGLSEGDAAPFELGPRAGPGHTVQSIAESLGGNRPGVDVWRVKGQAMALAGLLLDDFILVDLNQSERVRAGDVVVAQIYQRNGTANTILRRYEPPVLVAASADPADGRVHVIDGSNVVIRGKIIASWRC